MKITEKLTKLDKYSIFFRNYQYVLCMQFTEELMGVKLSDVMSVNVTLSTKNPKKKGFRKVILNYATSTMGGVYYDTLEKQQRVLNDLGIKSGNSFWMKAELA